jgi:hypothetical protein
LVQRHLEFAQVSAALETTLQTLHDRALIAADVNSALPRKLRMALGDVQFVVSVLILI